LVSQPTLKSLAQILIHSLIVHITGIHVILFAICVSLLLSRKMRLKYPMLAGITAMFALSIADIAFSWRVILLAPQTMVVGDTISFMMKAYPKFYIFVTNNLIAVSLMVRLIFLPCYGGFNVLCSHHSDNRQIIRCYVVWGRSLYVAIPSAITLLIGTGGSSLVLDLSPLSSSHGNEGFGYASNVNQPSRMKMSTGISFLTFMVLNNILTIFTGMHAFSCPVPVQSLSPETIAGRIWWLARRTGRRKGQYRQTSAIL